jgi:hypothetical protein
MTMRRATIGTRNFSRIAVRMSYVYATDLERVAELLAVGARGGRREADDLAGEVREDRLVAVRRRVMCLVDDDQREVVARPAQEPLALERLHRCDDDLRLRARSVLAALHVRPQAEVLELAACLTDELVAVNDDEHLAAHRDPGPRELGERDRLARAGRGNHERSVHAVQRLADRGEDGDLVRTRPLVR